MLEELDGAVGDLGEREHPLVVPARLHLPDPAFDLVVHQEVRLGLVDDPGRDDLLREDLRPETSVDVEMSVDLDRGADHRRVRGGRRTSRYLSS